MKGTLLAVLLFASAAVCSSANSAPSVPQSVADAWPDKWCQALPGITPEQLVAIMGPPTNAWDTQMEWGANQYQFNAFFNSIDGTVKQLDINTFRLSDAEKAALKCSATRTRKSVEAERRAAQLAAHPAAPVRSQPSACSLVLESEMSAILGAPVASQGYGKSKCIYRPTTPEMISPYAELSVDYGSGKAGMWGAAKLEQHEPGITSPYDEIGDQAVVAGPLLMIRTGDDLVSIVLSGVTDDAVAAKKIFDTAKARMDSAPLRGHLE